MASQRKRVLISAGETSGDLHGSRLVAAIKSLNPDVLFYGIGGEKLKEAGVETLFSTSELAVVGIVEVFSHLGTIYRAFHALRNSLDAAKPDLIILIDYPDFNLRLAVQAKKRGIPVLYYISPQVWAWRRGRIKKIAACVDKMLVVFPFEVPLYKEEGVDVEWVGHPLLEAVPPAGSCQEALTKLNLDDDKTTIGLLPGSRKGEVRRILPPMLKASETLSYELNDLQFVLPLAPDVREEDVRPILKDSTAHVKLVRNSIHEVLSLSRLVLVASGTATLETAIMGKPMVVLYRISFPTYLIGKFLVKVKTIGLVNIVAGKAIVPELIQRDANGQRIAQEASNLLKNSLLYHRIEDELKVVKERLGSPGASAKAAHVALKMMGC